MTLTQTKPATRNKYQARLDELHQLSNELHQQSLTNPTEELVRRIEEIAAERERIYQEWEKSWQAPAANAIEPAPATIPAPATPAAPSHTAPTTAAIPATRATKKLMPAIVPVKRLTSDISASNFDRHELEIAAELSLAVGGFCNPLIVRRDGGSYRVVSGHFQYHAAVRARAIDPRAGENIPAIVLEPENEAAILAQIEMLKLRRF